MEPVEDIQPYQYEVSESADGVMALHLQGRMDSSGASHMLEALTSLLRDRFPSSLTLDLGKVTYLDDFGALVILEIREMMTRGGGNFDLKNASEEILNILDFEYYFKLTSSLIEGDVAAASDVVAASTDDDSAASDSS